MASACMLAATCLIRSSSSGGRGSGLCTSTDVDADALLSPLPDGYSWASFGGRGRACVGGGGRGGMLVMVSERPTRDRRLDDELADDDDGLEGRSNALDDGDGVRISPDVHGRGADSDPLRLGGVGSGLDPRNDFVG